MSEKIKTRKRRGGVGEGRRGGGEREEEGKKGGEGEGGGVRVPTAYYLRSCGQTTVLHNNESLSNIKHSVCASLLLLLPREVVHLPGDCVHAYHINKAAMLTMKVHLFPFLPPATSWEN